MRLVWLAVLAALVVAFMKVPEQQPAPVDCGTALACGVEMPVRSALRRATENRLRWLGLIK
jgi:hypothetical protein